ncbi:hypothetical protein GF327_03085 [Candidatus Woesearchaeota archaeon]|nr:hypothetical protein [Candidatus Woesearchaeota archaeon]
MDNQICFLNLTTKGTYILGKDDSIHINYINKKISVKNIKFFPEKEISYLEFDSFLTSLDFEKFDLILFSLTSFSNNFFKKAASFIRENHPDKIIIAGGAHFQDKKSAEYALKKNYCDFVCLGSINVIKNLIEKIDSVSINSIKSFIETNKLKGLYYLEEDNFKGTGHSIYSEEKIPILLVKKQKIGIVVDVLLNNQCSNNCGFCVSPKHIITVPVKNYIREINSQLNGLKIRLVNLYDNNPLCRENFSRTERFFKLFLKKFDYIPNIVLYADPSVIMENKEIIDFLESFPCSNNNLFLGREAVCEKISEKIARKYKGKFRGQDRLDKEQEIIKKLSKKLGGNFTIVLNYILTPFETYDSLTKLQTEFNELTKLNRVVLRSNFLWPLPGTYVSRKYPEKYVRIEKLDVSLKYINMGGINYWDNDFLDLCFALKAKPFWDFRDPYFSFYSLSMFKLAKLIFFEEYIKQESVNELLNPIPAQLKSLIKRTSRFLKIIDKKKLYEKTLQNKIELMRYSHTEILNLPLKFVKEMADEFKQIIEFKKAYF